MEFTQEMNLVSESGYCMPFEDKGGEIIIKRDYGNGHLGVDFATNKYLLAAVGDGIVSGIGADTKEHGLFVTVKYGKYEVTYSGLTNIYTQFGQRVVAGSCIAMSSDLVHIEVSFNGEVINPMDFLTMLFGNVKMWSQRGVPQPEYAFTDLDIFTDYEKEKDEIEQLMMRYYANYMADMNSGQYIVPERTGESLRSLFTVGALKNYFYESIPSMINPLGIGRRSVPMITKAQNLLIGDFLNYLALRHRIFLSTMDESAKKRLDLAIAGSGIIDPLAELRIDAQSFDIPRLVSVYPDRAGIRFWTKAWFNNREDGEAAVEIELENAIRFIHGNIDKEQWLEDYFPKQMESYRNAIQQTREQLINQQLTQ